MNTIAKVALLPFAAVYLIVLGAWRLVVNVADDIWGEVRP